MAKDAGAVLRAFAISLCSSILLFFLIPFATVIIAGFFGKEGSNQGMTALMSSLFIAPVFFLATWALLYKRFSKK